MPRHFSKIINRRHYSVQRKMTFTQNVNGFLKCMIHVLKKSLKK